MAVCASKGATIHQDHVALNVYLEVCIDSPANGDQIAGNGPTIVTGHGIATRVAPGHSNHVQWPGKQYAGLDQVGTDGSPGPATKFHLVLERRHAGFGQQCDHYCPGNGGHRR